MGLNGALHRRLVAVEVLVPAPAPAVDQEALDRAEWLSIAPMAALDYLVSVAEADPDRTEPHLIADVVIASVWEAARYDVSSALEYVQARVLDKAVFTLSWALAGRSWCYAHHFEAIRLLLGEESLLTSADLRRSTPQFYLERWRIAGTDDRDILAKAGLHAAELALLEAEDDQEGETQWRPG